MLPARSAATRSARACRPATCRPLAPLAAVRPVARRGRRRWRRAVGVAIAVAAIGRAPVHRAAGAARSGRLNAQQQPDDRPARAAPRRPPGRQRASGPDRVPIEPARRTRRSAAAARAESRRPIAIDLQTRCDERRRTASADAADSGHGPSRCRPVPGRSTYHAGHEQQERQQPAPWPEGRPQDVVDTAVEQRPRRAAAGRSA